MKIFKPPMNDEELLASCRRMLAIVREKIEEQNQLRHLIDTTCRDTPHSERWLEISHKVFDSDMRNLVEVAEIYDVAIDELESDRRS